MAMKITITHNLLIAKLFEIRFFPEQTVEDMKEKIRQCTGSAVNFQDLSFVKNNRRVKMYPDNAHLQDLGLEDGDMVDCYDRNPYAIVKDLVTLRYGPDAVEGTKLDDEYWKKYNASNNSVKSHIDERYKNDANFRKIVNDAAAKRKEAAEVEKQLITQLQIGDRCETTKGLRGTIRWSGLCEELGEGLYVGVELDEPLGENVFSKFAVKDKFGALLKPDQLKAGDYPERGLDLEGSSEL